VLEDEDEDGEGAGGEDERGEEGPQKNEGEDETMLRMELEASMSKNGCSAWAAWLKKGRVGSVSHHFLMAACCG
jgi:hypothetical protein